MRIFYYSCRVRCYDGIERTFKHQGFFENRELLHSCLHKWDGCPGPNGGTYHYFESFFDVLRNELSVSLEWGFHYPTHTVLHYGTYAHVNVFVEGYDYNRLEAIIRRCCR